MNSIKIEMLKEDNFLTEDSAILDDLFFIPKNTKIKDYHLNLLKKWKVESLSTSGNLLKTSQPGEAGESNLLEDIFSDNNNLIAPDEDEDVPVTESVNDSNHVDVVDSFKDIYKRWIVAIMNFFNEIITNKNVDKQKVVNLLQDIEQFINRDKNQVLMLFGERFEGVSNIYLQTIESVILAFGLSKNLELSDFAKTNLVIGTLFHDLGMLKVPKAILEKKGALSKEELTAIQNHTVIGFKYLRDAKYSAIVASGALQHHERLDGKGYPAHIKSDKITQIGKIVGVVDAYCAAISSKPFRDPLHAKEAVQDLLKKGGTLYDADILREFVKIISFYPIGSLILLSNDIPAKVIGTSGVAMRPIVTTVGQENSETIDLSQRKDLYIKGVYRQREKINIE
ncbi:MAG: HD domain-containing protein [Spirochaetes bacterium]|nr:HD domain-containing protein [Spirochaetota bacterium]